jgi:hypothetical protein
LPARRRETSLKAGLGLRRVGKSRQQLAFRAMDLGLAPALAGLLDLLQGLVEEIEAVAERARRGGENRDLCPKKGRSAVAPRSMKAAIPSRMTSIPRATCVAESTQPR